MARAVRIMLVQTLKITVVGILLSGRKSCGADNVKLYTSTCDVDTDWNRKDVAGQLKAWIRSIKVDENKMPTDKAISFYDNESNRLHFIGAVTYEGFANGPYWMSNGFSAASPFTNGFLYGFLDEVGKMTGPNVTFLYPDMKTVMVGQFNESIMISAKESVVSAERCKNGIKEIRVRKPKTNKPVMRYEEATEIRFSGDPTVTDPYERKTVYVKDTPDKGEGLFAKRDIQAGEHIAYYAGMRQDASVRPIFMSNQTREEMFIIHKNLIVLKGGVHMNIPHEYWSLDKFRATLAHKTNHAFDGKLNCAFNAIFHPRYGTVRGIEATKFIPKGQEIFVDYGYGMRSFNPKWYYDVYRVEVGELPLHAFNLYQKEWGPLQNMNLSKGDAATDHKVKGATVKISQK